MSTLATWQATSRRRLCRLIDPSGFFNADASLELDRLTIENERLREEMAALKERAQL